MPLRPRLIAGVVIMLSVFVLAVRALLPRILADPGAGTLTGAAPASPRPEQIVDAMPARAALSQGAPVEAGAAPDPHSGSMPLDLQKAADQIGIAAIVTGEDDVRAPSSFLGERPGEPGSREQAETYIRRFASMRQQIESGKAPPVALPGETAGLLAEKDPGGAAIEAEPPAAKAPQTPPPPTPAAEPGSWHGFYSGGQDGNHAITDETTWKAVWSSLSQEPAPTVDFTRQQVMAVFLGYRPTGGYIVRITKIIYEEAAVVVTFRELPPLPGRTAPEGPTTPYALKLAARSPLPVRFDRAD